MGKALQYIAGTVELHFIAYTYERLCVKIHDTADPGDVPAILEGTGVFRWMGKALQCRVYIAVTVELHFTAYIYERHCFKMVQSDVGGRVKKASHQAFSLIDHENRKKCLDCSVD